MAFVDALAYVQHLLGGLGAGVVGGVAGGVLAGLAGLGGGLIYVPLLYLVLPANAGDSLGVAVFTSMLAVAFTGFFSARAHLRLRHVDAALLLRVMPGLAFGAVLGLWSALRLPESVILGGLACLDAWVALDYGRKVAASARLTQAARDLAAVPIGLVSGALGIGGGTMLAPLLRGALPLRQAIGTTSAAGFLMAVAATVINLGAEAGWRGALAPHAPLMVGFLLGLLTVMPRATAWAAGLHDRLDEAVLRRALVRLFQMLACVMAVAAIVKL
ncbi:MAG: sulfite exporter TauE/SafE family protein [Mariprofundaceae bacterium]